ncbi:lysylphosphatidylglycerol synthase transmembrane domain-containing protein [Chryseobacterium sp. A301]
METKRKTPLLKTLVTIGISVAVAVFFLWLAFRGLDIHAIQGYFAEANYLWVLFAAVFGLLAYWIRAIRWNLLLEPMGYRISNSNALWTISFGYLMNLTVPRSGELARSTALYGVEKVPVDQSFGTIILERVIDLLCMMLFLCLALILKYDAIQSFFNYAFSQQGAESSSSGYWILVIGLILVSGAVLFFSLRSKLQAIAFFSKLYGIVDGLIEGMTSIFRLRRPGLFLLYSLAIWICYYLAAYIVCFALPETAGFSPADGLFIIVIGTLGMIVPASGGIGAFHLAVKLGIGALFVSAGGSFEKGAEIGLAYAFISHTLQLVIMAVMGFISIPLLAKARSKSPALAK